MKVLCWNANGSVFEHWKKVVPSEASLVQTQGYEETLNRLEHDSFDYCFVYLDNDAFSEKVELVVQIREHYPNVKMVAFPYLRSQSAGVRMLSMGVNAQCSPYIAKEQLGLVLSVVDSGEIWGGKELIQQLIQNSSQNTAAHSDVLSFEGSELLSERELAVADKVAKGLSNKEIARHLDVTERTIKAHLTAIFKKLQIKDRLSLALLVQRG
ncbi:response regulator transcription factor [Marinomonas fungiae]|uniref:DNA-binding response regulator, NarL/FixJ family, contains REC and HTH domains n=1 Tax=Marinomonas fungiae TaxID=1137284 RepID=A0A0K6IH19_9GAMM|nr:response regulator transcription factor [Marinomonas fungiae]CUB02356.1 DNA-binding response regulator, NarL/FixJ family, contains REC and HTH domains [Marinomonas fungiae]